MVDVQITAEHITELRLLKRGDHIGVVGDIGVAEYFHHGIFLGHTIGVAHFSGICKEDVTIKKDDIFAFTEEGKRKLIRYVYNPDDCRSPEDVAITAEDLCTNPNKWNPYDLLENNCEHFATWCKIGKAVSKQVLERLKNYDPVIFAVIAVSVASSSVPSSSLVYSGSGMSYSGSMSSYTKKNKKD